MTVATNRTIHKLIKDRIMKCSTGDKKNSGEWVSEEWVSEEW